MHEIGWKPPLGSGNRTDRVGDDDGLEHRVTDTAGA
jgi:hypothetical protein